MAGIQMSDFICGSITYNTLDILGLYFHKYKQRLPYWLKTFSFITYGTTIYILVMQCHISELSCVIRSRLHHITAA